MGANVLKARLESGPLLSMACEIISLVSWVVIVKPVDRYVTCDILYFTLRDTRTFQLLYHSFSCTMVAHPSAVISFSWFSWLCYSWLSPSQHHLKAKIERVQSTATRWMLRTRVGEFELSYGERLEWLNLLPLVLDRVLKDLVFFYKYLHEYTDLNTGSPSCLVTVNMTLRNGVIIKVCMGNTSIPRNSSK